MKLKPGFELIDVAGEYILVATGTGDVPFNGVVALNDAAAFVISNMKSVKSNGELVELLVNEYGISKAIAETDISELFEKLLKFGVVEEA